MAVICACAFSGPPSSHRSTQPSIFVSALAPFISTPLAADIQRTLLHLCESQLLAALGFFAMVSMDAHAAIRFTYLINTCPNVPVCFLSMYSSVLLSCMFMYESTLTNWPLYSVWAHFSRTTTSSLILRRDRLAMISLHVQAQR